MSEQRYTIEIDGMEFHAFHGCYKEERQCGAHFIVSLRIELQRSRVFETDEVCDTVSYLDIYDQTRRIMSNSVQTLERLSRNIIEALHARFPQILHIRCRVEKLAPPVGGKVKGISVILDD